MNDWQPTMNLRFVTRRYPYDDIPGAIRTVRILQQQWELETKGYGVTETEYEWRDVPEVSDE